VTGEGRDIASHRRNQVAPRAARLLRTLQAEISRVVTGLIVKCTHATFVTDHDAVDAAGLAEVECQVVRPCSAGARPFVGIALRPFALDGLVRADLGIER